MDPGPEVDAVLGDALEALRIVTILATPALPESCPKIWARIGLEGDPANQGWPGCVEWGGYPGGVPVTTTARSSSRCSTLAMVDRKSACIRPVQALWRCGRCSDTVATGPSMSHLTVSLIPT